MLLCGCISYQMLVSDLHRFNIYEIRQIYSSHLKKAISVIVNSQQSRSESALLGYSEVAFMCMLFVWGTDCFFLRTPEGEV